jgi:hypothetical protein
VTLGPARPGQRGIRVVAGQRSAGEEGALALGLGLDAAELARVVADCGARRVHLRIADPRDPMQAAGSRTLTALLKEARVDATPLGPAEQLSLI